MTLHMQAQKNIFYPQFISRPCNHMSARAAEGNIRRDTVFFCRASAHIAKFLYLEATEIKEMESAALEVGEDILNSALAHSLSYWIHKGCGVSNIEK